MHHSRYSRPESGDVGSDCSPQPLDSSSLPVLRVGAEVDSGGGVGWKAAMIVAYLSLHQRSQVLGQVVIQLTLAAERLDALIQFQRSSGGRIQYLRHLFHISQSSGQELGDNPLLKSVQKV